MPQTDIRLTQTVSCAGCAAKLDPTMLMTALRGVPWPQSDRVLVGFDQCDDAGVFALEDGSKLVATTDFFTPVVDDPQTYGAAAAANALSDIYAMGAEPLYALSIVHYPEDLGGEILREILTGAAEICTEAECPVIGGHSVKADMMTFGLAITGRLAPGVEPVANAGARPGDALVLTKRLGTGILATALKKGLLDPEAIAALVANLTRLNRHAGALLHPHGVHAATDVTGFSLAGHGAELASASDVTLEIEAASLPLLPGLEAAIAAKCITRGDASNRRYAGERLVFAAGVPALVEHACVDPQSSGGFLIALPEAGADALVAELRAGGDEHATRIGRVVAGPARVVIG